MANLEYYLKAQAAGGGTVTVENSDGTYSQSVTCGSTLILPDITHSDSDGSAVTQPAQNVFTSTVCTGGGGSVGADLMPTNQTVSYRTGDDGSVQAGRATDFLTLSSNNPFGNTNRFTDELGGQTYTNKIVIDWSTYNGTEVLGYGDSQFTLFTWDNAIDNALVTSIGTYTSGWRLPNINELWSLSNMGVSSNKGLDYYPWTALTWVVASSNFWSSTTTPYATTQAMILKSFTIEIDNKTKTQTAQYIPVREFTDTETVLK